MLASAMRGTRRSSESGRRGRDGLPRDERRWAPRGGPGWALLVFAAGACGSSQAPAVVPAAAGPAVTVSLVHAGAGAAEIEREVIEPIEQVVGSLAGLRSIRSAIEPGRASVVVTFEAARPLEVAADEVRRALGAAQRMLPVGVAPPTISLADPGGPVLWLELAGPLSRVELSELARGAIRTRLEQLAGVGAIELEGAIERRIAIRPDLDRLAAMGVTLGELAAAVRDAALALPAGRLGATGSTIRAAAPPARIEELGELAVGTRGGAVIRLRDVAAIAEDAGPDPGVPLALGVRLRQGGGGAPSGPLALLAPDERSRRAAAREEVLGRVRVAAAELRAKLPEQVTLTERSAAPPGQRAAAPFALAVQGPDRAALRAIAAKLEGQLRASSAITEVTVAPEPGRPEQTLQIDRARAAQLGVSSEQIAATIHAALGGDSLGALHSDGAGRAALEIVLRVDGSPADVLPRAAVRSARGELVPLSALATIAATSSEHLLRIDRSPAIELTVRLALGSSPTASRARLVELTRDLPPGYRATVSP